MKQFTVELDEMLCMWLAHISEVTGESVENLIVSVLYRQVAALEDGINKSFGTQESA